MNLIPYQVYYLKTQLTPGQVIERLMANTDPKRFPFIGAPGRKPIEKFPFTGAISDNTFEIWQNPIHVVDTGGLKLDFVSYSASTLALQGTINADFNGSRVRIHARARLFTYVFMAFWLVILAFLATLTAIVTVRSPGVSLMLLLAVLALAIPFMFILWDFDRKNKETKKVLEDLLEAQDESKMIAG